MLLRLSTCFPIVSISSFAKFCDLKPVDCKVSPPTKKIQSKNTGFSYRMDSIFSYMLRLSYSKQCADIASKWSIHFTHRNIAKIFFFGMDFTELNPQNVRTNYKKNKNIYMNGISAPKKNIKGETHLPNHSPLRPR